MISDYSVFFVYCYTRKIADMLIRAGKLIEKRRLAAVLVADKRERQRPALWNYRLCSGMVLCKVAYSKLAVPRMRNLFYAFCTFMRVVAKMNVRYPDFFGIFKP